MSQKSVNRAAKHGARRKTRKTTTSKKKPLGGTADAKATDEKKTAGRKTGRRKAATPKAARLKAARARIDWPAVEADWRTGIAVRELARRHGISASTIYRRARKHRWQRAAKPAAPAVVRAAKAAVPNTAGRGAAAVPSPAPDDLSRLRALTAKLRERLERVIDGETAADAVLGARESPAALLLKLCQITEKIIAIERRVAGADAPTHAEINEQDRDILDRFKRRYGMGNIHRERS